jgi:hypothetical protein
VLIAASLVVGQAILSLCERREPTWLAGPVGLAALLVAAGVAIKLPGHGTAVAITLLLLVLASGAILARRRVPGAGPTSFRSRTARTVRSMDAERSSETHPASAAIAAGIALAFASIPFIVNGRVGILGVGLVNDDMASHLLIADWLNTRLGDMPGLIRHGYPVGPHALAAGLSEGLGTGLIEAFAGITLATPALTALVAAGVLRGLRPVPRVLVAVVAALPYLAAAYLAQGAFKEPIEALFVLSFALLLPSATSVRRALPLGVIAAGAVYAYSFPGLFWLLGTAVVYVAVAQLTGTAGLRLKRRRRPPEGAGGERSARLRARTLVTASVVLGVLVVLTAPEWARLVDFTGFRAFRGSTISSGLGNLRHQLSPLEALGIWPASDFRLSASAATGPAPAFYLGALLAAVALAFGLPRWLRRHGAAVPSALAAAALIYLGALAFGTVYTSAKALAIAAPLITLVSLGGLLEGGRSAGDTAASPGSRPPVLLWALAAAVGLGIAISSFLVLRPAPVGPEDHAAQLAKLRPLVQGRKVLFLGRDNFVVYELRGSRAFTAVRNYYDPNYVKPNLRLRDVFRKFDFDSVTPSTLDRFPYVITTRAAYASGPPPTFRPVRRTGDFVLWKRTGPVGERRTLAEADRPGARLDCSDPPGRRLAAAAGSATVFRAPPVIGGDWSPSATVQSGSQSTQTLKVPAGSWEVSLQYDSTRPVRVRAPGLNATLPANLDYRGSVPFYAAGTMTSPRGGSKPFTVTVQRPPLAGRLLGADSVAHLGAIALSRVSPDRAGDPIPGISQRRVRFGQACGRYLDWYGGGG